MEGVQEETLVVDQKPSLGDPLDTQAAQPDAMPQSVAGVTVEASGDDQDLGATAQVAGAPSSIGVGARSKTGSLPPGGPDVDEKERKRMTDRRDRDLRARERDERRAAAESNLNFIYEQEQEMLQAKDRLSGLAQSTASQKLAYRSAEREVEPESLSEAFFERLSEQADALVELRREMSHTR